MFQIGDKVFQIEEPSKVGIIFEINFDYEENMYLNIEWNSGVKESLYAEEVAKPIKVYRRSYPREEPD